MLSSAEHEISMLDKSHLINLLEKLLIYRKFRCFCLSNQTFKFDLSYTLKHQCDFKFNTTFFPKPRTSFLMCFSGETRKYAGKKVLLNRVSNSQSPGHWSTVEIQQNTVKTTFFPKPTTAFLT